MVTEELTNLKKQIDQINWYHSIDLGHGLVTPGNNTTRQLKRIKLPTSLKGRTVLDIGAWDGYFSFEAERRGAKRVLATDSFVWNWPRGKAGFDLVKRHFSSKVEEMNIDVLDLSPEEIGTWDVVLFLGILYHMQHPLLALEKVASVTKEMVIIETIVDMLSHKRPAIAFYPSNELSNDPTNWFGPNPAALVAMLKVVGFERVEVVSGPRSIFFRICKAAWYKHKRGFPFWSTAHTDRISVHAWK